MSLLEVEDLKVKFKTRDGIVQPLNGVSFSLATGEILGLVGETGSGKSVTAQAVMGLLPFLDGWVSRGKMSFMGIDLLALSEAEYQTLRGKRMAMISQNPMTSLDPVYTVGSQIVEGLLLHSKLTKKEAADKAVDMMASLGIPNAGKVFVQYPHQLSGGLKQRIVIAMGLCANPKLLIADEPTTALDVTVQAQIVELLRQTTMQRNTGLIMITHDLGVISHLCDRVAVMYAGSLVEIGSVKTVFTEPGHPYTRSLIKCIPSIGMASGSLKAIPGSVPSVRTFPPGCCFHPRCKDAADLCAETPPEITALDSDRHIRCHKYTFQWRHVQ